MPYPRATTKLWLRSGSAAGQRRFLGPREPAGAYGRPKNIPEPMTLPAWRVAWTAAN